MACKPCIQYMGQGMCPPPPPAQRMPVQSETNKHQSAYDDCATLHWRLPSYSVSISPLWQSAVTCGFSTVAHKCQSNLHRSSQHTQFVVLPLAAFLQHNELLCCKVTTQQFLHRSPWHNQLLCRRLLCGNIFVLSYLTHNTTNCCVARTWSYFATELEAMVEATLLTWQH